MTGMEGVQVISLSLGYVMGQALHAAAKLGIADALASGPKNIDALAKATETDPAALRRLMRTLASGGIFAEGDDGSYALTPLSETLRSDVPGSVRAAVIWVSEPMHYATCGSLPETVKSGRPAFDGLFGVPYFDFLADNAELARVWDEGMACFSGMEDAPIANAYTFPPNATIVDVGGGQGGFLAEALKSDGSLRGVLFDRAEVIANPRLLMEADVVERCQLAGGDFFERVTANGDVYVLKRILHDWDDATCVTILRRCREAMSPNGRLLVIDAVIPPGSDPHPAKIVDLVMIGVLPGRERTEEEFASLFACAGFRLQRVIPTHSMLAIVEAIPV
jgi:O-methyltransferase domain/Dimerisation domain